MANKKPTALTIGFDFVQSLIEACQGDYSLFGDLIHAMFRYGELGIEPEYAAGTPCSILWPMARNKTHHILHSYEEKVKKSIIGGKKTQIKNKLKSFGASDELVESFFADSLWLSFETSGNEPEGGWDRILKEYISTNIADAPYNTAQDTSRDQSNHNQSQSDSIS